MKAAFFAEGEISGCTNEPSVTSEKIFSFCRKKRIYKKRSLVFPPRRQTRWKVFVQVKQENMNSKTLRSEAYAEFNPATILYFQLEDTAAVRITKAFEPPAAYEASQCVQMLAVMRTLSITNSAVARSLLYSQESFSLSK